MMTQESKTAQVVERRVIDASRSATLVAGWANPRWARRVNSISGIPTVEVTVQLRGVNKFSDDVSVILRLDANQIRRLVQESGVDESIVSNWLAANGKTVRDKDESEGGGGYPRKGREG